MHMRYVVTTMGDILKNHMDIIKENYDDMGDDGAELSPDLSLYEICEKDEQCFGIVVYDGDDVIAYASVMAARATHCDVVYASNDAMYVKPAYRKSTVPGRLLKLMESEAKKRNCDTFLWEVPVRSTLAEALKKRDDYKLSEVIFEKEL